MNTERSEVPTLRAPGVVTSALRPEIATEPLFLTSGAPAPFFEMIERGGSYLVPLALACLLTRSSAAPQPSGLPAA